MRELHLLCNGLMYQTLNCANLMTWQWVWSFFFYFLWKLFFRDSLLRFQLLFMLMLISYNFPKMYENAFYFHVKKETVMAMFSSDSSLNCVEFCVEFFSSFNTSNSLDIFSMTHVWFDSISQYMFSDIISVWNSAGGSTDALATLTVTFRLKIWFFCYVIAPETKTAAHLLHSPYWIKISKWW